MRGQKVEDDKEEEEEEEKEKRGMCAAREEWETVEGTDKNGVVGKHALTRPKEELTLNSLNLPCSQPAR